MAIWKSTSTYKRLNRLATDQQGFSLLESMVALFVVSLTLVLVQSLVGEISQVQPRLDHSKQAEWHIFLHQLPFEMEGYHLAKATDRQVLFKGDGIHQAESESADLMFRRHAVIRRVNYRGHQPLLTDIKTFRFDQESDRLLRMSVEFNNGESFQARVRFPAPPPVQRIAPEEATIDHEDHEGEEEKDTESDPAQEVLPGQDNPPS